MATLVSPGVSVTVTDESFYVSAGQGTVPFIMIATQQDKPVSAGTDVINPDIASGTTSANAGKLWLISSQRELLQTFGTPVFYSESGAQVHGSPINEYGLLAAHSYMGIANRAYVMRADVDTYELQPSTTPLKTTEDTVVPQVPGPYWIDLSNSELGMYIRERDSDMSIAPDAYAVSESFDDLTPPRSSYDVGVVYGTGVLVYYSAYTENGTDYFWTEMDNSSAYFTTVAGHRYEATRFEPSNGSELFRFWLNYANEEPSWPGISLAVADYNESTEEYDTVEVSAFTDDDSAEEELDEVVEGSLYFLVDTLKANVTLRRYDGSTWADVDSSEIAYTTDGTAPNISAVTSLPVGTVPVADSKWYNPDPTVVDVLVSTIVSDQDGDGIDDTIWDEFQEQLFVQPEDPSKVDFQTPVDGDLWLDTDELDNYPTFYLRASGSWVMIDNSDSEQIIFADARSAPSEQVDADAPNAAVYPEGTILFNTRYSGRNVKEWKVDYSTEAGELIGDRWVSISGLNEDGSLKSGDASVKAVVVEAMKDAMADSDDLRAEAIFYNLIATPGYVELIPDMVSLNVDRKEQAFVLGDSPFTLKPTGTEVQAWANNENGAASDGDVGLVTTSAYLGVHYPSGYTTNLDGNGVVVPPSHITLRTCAYNDQVAYQWFAPAGLQRGEVSNATTVGYIDDEGEFVTTNLSQGMRDILYVNKINPIAVIPNRGLHVWGQKTRNPSESALDRINVARLINYLRYQAENAVYPYLFEPNDSLTRTNAKATVDTLCANLVTLRGLYDFLVVCDESNNTSDRIDRNELWIDIAIQPTKAVEFIYIPIRIRNTGEDLAS